MHARGGSFHAHDHICPLSTDFVCCYFSLSRQARHLSLDAATLRPTHTTGVSNTLSDITRSEIVYELSLIAWHMPRHKQYEQARSY